MAAFKPGEDYQGLLASEYNALMQLGEGYEAIQSFLESYFVPVADGEFYILKPGTSNEAFLRLLEEVDLNEDYELTWFSYEKSTWSIAGF